MGDRSYLQVTVYDCPSRRRQVAELLAQYVTYQGDLLSGEEPDPDEVVVGEQYTTEEISLGSMTELAGGLISAAPRCSFLGWQDPYGGDTGDLVAYSPKWGRFDAECTSGGAVLLGPDGVQRLAADAAAQGYLDRDSVLRLNSEGMNQRDRAAWEAVPGLAEAIEVASGIPWLQDAAGTPVPRPRQLAWAAVIDREHETAARRRQAEFAALADRVDKLGLAGHASAIRAATPGLLPDAARRAAAACEEILKGRSAARGQEKERDPDAALPWDLRRWAQAANDAHAARRRT